MLKKIRCEIFREPLITFNKGLNVVLGDNKASNSIGKSTMLMIIDFIFGGNSYIVANHDVIQEFGNHEFYFEFNFSDEQLFFIRSTEKNSKISCCNSNYEELSKITLKEYNAILKDKYKIKLQDVTFRQIVSLYSRIWGKGNYDVKRPLQQQGSKAKDAIEDIIKLFSKYEDIKELSAIIKDLSEQKDIILKGGKKNFIPNITKTIYNKNIKDIDIFKK